LLLPMIRRLHTSCAPHRDDRPFIVLTETKFRLHTVDSTDRWRPARAPRLRRMRAQSDCSFRRHWHAPPSSHLWRAPPSSHRRLHWPSSAGACAAPPKEENPIRLLIPSQPTRPTVFTPSSPLAVGVLRVRHASCAPRRLHTVVSTGRLRPARAPRLLADAGILATSCMHPHKSTPIASLPRRCSHPRNCRPSALEVILRCPQEPPPPKPLSPLVSALWLLPAHAAAQQSLPCRPRPPSCAPAHAPPSSHRRLQWPSASCACTSTMH